MTRNVSQEMSRRSFLGGTTLAALSAGVFINNLAQNAVAFADEAPEEPVASEAGSEVVSSTQGSSVWAQLNPQDDSYMTNSITDWTQTTLLSPLDIGGVTLRNRMIKSAATSGTTTDATQMVPFYGNIAKGGVGCIILEGGYQIFPQLDTDEMRLTEDNRPVLEEGPLPAVIEEIHAAGCPCFAQIKTSGGVPTYNWHNTPETGSDHKASELTEEDIEMFISDFIEATARYQAIGADGVDINAAGDNLPGWFLSRARNDRPAEDPYGPASVENRCRMVTDIIAGIRERCGEDFAIQVLINGAEENDSPTGSLTEATSVEEAAMIAQVLEAAGADALEVRLGVFANHDAQFMNDGYFGGRGLEGSNSSGGFFDFSRHFGGHLDGSRSGCGLMLGAAKYIKEKVSIPVGAVTYMDPAHAPDMFEAALANGEIDFYYMNRPISNADNDYPNKLAENRLEDIRPCTHCLHCAGDFNNHLGVSEGCRVNACKGRAYTEAMPEGVELPAGDGQKNVMVIGGGPAGMEAARVCAERGYAVTLYEKSSLGGLVNFASVVKGKHENLEQMRDWFIHMLDVDGVTVVTDTEVTADLVREEAPDVVFVAAGALRPEIAIEGSGSVSVVGISDFMFQDLGENVLVKGFNAQALDTAVYLTSVGKRVFMVDEDVQANLGKGQSRAMLSFVLPGLYATGVRIFPESSIVSVGDKSATILNAATGVETTIAIDSIVDASDMVPNTALADELTGEFEVYTVGDCADPWDIQAAVATANLAARSC